MLRCAHQRKRQLTGALLGILVLTVSAAAQQTWLRADDVDSNSKSSLIVPSAAQGVFYIKRLQAPEACRLDAIVVLVGAVESGPADQLRLWVRAEQNGTMGQQITSADERVTALPGERLQEFLFEFHGSPVTVQGPFWIMLQGAAGRIGVAYSQPGKNADAYWDGRKLGQASNPTLPLQPGFFDTAFCVRALVTPLSAPPPPAPVITRILPQPRASAGTMLVIEGQHLGDGDAFVMFTGEMVEAQGSAGDGTRLHVKVPAAAQTGPLYVVVDRRQSNSLQFTMQGAAGPAPVISRLSNATPRRGETIKIVGQNLVGGDTRIRFTGASTTPTGMSLDRGSIDVVVPPGAQTGPLDVMVGGQASNQVQVTITP